MLYLGNAEEEEDAVSSIRVVFKNIHVNTFRNECTELPLVEKCQ